MKGFEACWLCLICRISLEQLFGMLNTNYYLGKVGESFMEIKELIDWILQIMKFLILLSALIASAVAAVITVIPDSSASRECRLGYKAHCSFTPISTIILIVLAIVFALLFIKIYWKKITSSS